MHQAPDRITASSSSTLGVHRRRRSSRCSSVGSRQSAHLPRLVHKVLGLTLVLGLFGGASHAQTTGPCVATDVAIKGAQAIISGVTDVERASLAEDCTALLAFKAALTLSGGDSLNWNRNMGMHLWQSIGLNARRSRVTRITLGPSYDVTGVTGGTLPDLSGLDALSTLRFSFNPDLAATAFPAWVKDLTNLTHLDLQGNNFTGSIPDWSALTELRVLDLSRNDLTGTIPALTGLVKLEKLALSRNKLTGSIPALNGITTLKWVDLNDNNLTGEIPALSALVKLERLNVGNNFRFDGRGVGNNLTGEIPSLSTLVKLKHLRLNDNKLTGGIPALPTGNNLQEISAHFNSLTGGIPSIASTGMRVLNLRGNEMTGNIDNVTAATGITHLLLGSNGFTGAIPDDLDNLTNLQHLSLCGTSLTGSILPDDTNTRLTDGDLTLWRCLDIADAEADEGEAVTFRATYSRFPLNSGQSPISVRLRTEEGTATAADFAPLSGPIRNTIGTIAAGSNETTWELPEVPTRTDCVVEDPETFTMAILRYDLFDVLWSYGGTGTINDVAPVPGCFSDSDPDDDPDSDPDDDPDSDPDDDPDDDSDSDPEPEPDPDRFVAPYWRGAGGIVVKPANGLSVTFEMSCSGDRTTETLYPNDDGLIVQLVRRDACMDDDGNPVRGELSVSDIEPGGWYWVDGPRNAAVAPLVSEVELGGVAATIPAGVETDATANGTFFEHEAGRMIGIVPHLPTPDADACSEYVSPYWRGTGGIVVKPTDGEFAKLRTTCGGWNVTQTLQANDDGLVVQLLRGDGGSRANSCTDDAGNPMRGELSFEGVMPGGWYWVNGPLNAAVAPLVCRDMLNGPSATVPGGVRAHEADEGTLFEHDVAMLIGIVPHLRRPPEE